jgi:hypothetical protein
MTETSHGPQWTVGIMNLLASSCLFDGCIPVLLDDVDHRVQDLIETQISISVKVSGLKHD